ncbi:MAG: hypothetical protein PHT21_11320 [Lachnospiraceae bacterium]|nr:hypothetical protein [Lachnospiraceae bacterium]
MEKSKSKMIYGVAILLMLFHHLFLNLSIYDKTIFSLVDELFGWGTLSRIAWQGKICVALYAFISGYGIQTILQSVYVKTNGEMLPYFGNAYKRIFKMIIKFIIRYWIVVWLFLPIGFAMHVIRFDWKDAALTLIGISKRYNVEWWYVKQ